MKEASVLGPFMSKLREEIKGAQVFKHRDASMKGMVDSSITFMGRTIWFEAKLYPLPKRGDPGGEAWLKKAKEKSPAQAGVAERLNATSACLYVIWIKKTCVYVCYPYGSQTYQLKGTRQLVEFFRAFFAVWDSRPLACRPPLDEVWGRTDLS